MVKLIAIGFLSGLFFSSTFILNRLMSLEGGHWVWSASLRYAYMIVFLLGYLTFSRGLGGAGHLLRYFLRHWRFWVIAGSIGFGGFYSLLCFSADHAPGWVVATTWQFTIIATLIVLICFGKSFPAKTWLFSAIVFAGVLCVNLSQAGAADTKGLLMGGIPVLVAAFCYPIGNQLVWEAGKGNRRLPDIQSPFLENPFHKVLLLSLGSVPFWLLLLAINAPPPPSGGQLINTALVAFFSGICATSLFLYARSQSRRASELAAVDSTQSSEVIFAMIGEIIFLGSALPGGIALAGVATVLAGLALFVCFQETTA
ncbi:MAG: hypothetical protein AMJ54_08515 [Deltaproteobacteria bacterium SG8_13]|nr:MAG: hypothetical protein AMJ54_08515 [Deltaproteobacteria bacterium SG8_13]